MLSDTLYLNPFTNIASIYSRCFCPKLRTDKDQKEASDNVPAVTGVKGLAEGSSGDIITLTTMVFEPAMF